MALKIISHGLPTSIQDLGRPGYFHLGIPIGGAMDRFSLRGANMLVGNPEDAACLEVVFLGPKIEFTKDAIVAVTGAELPVRVDGEAREAWSSFEVKAGQVLSFDFLKAGARAYIAISGGMPCQAMGGIENLSIFSTVRRLIPKIRATSRRLIPSTRTA